MIMMAKTKFKKLIIIPSVREFPMGSGGTHISELEAVRLLSPPTCEDGVMREE